MEWKKIIKQPVDLEGQDSDVEENQPVSPSGFDRRDVMTQTAGRATGQFRELVDDIIGLMAEARKDPTNQRKVLGQIRFKIQQAGIAVVRE